MKQIKLSDLIAKQFHKTFEMKVPHIVEYGGRAGTKSSQNALRIAFSMLQDNNAEWIVIREHDKHHSDSTLRELIIAFERLGLINGHDFKYTKSPRKLILTRTGQTVSFAGLDDYEKLKGYKPSSEDKYFRGIWFFEITEMKGELELQQVISTFARGNKPNFNVIYEFNPAPLRSHWTYEFIEKYKDNSKYQITFSTYKRLTEWEQKNWLGIEFLDLIYELEKYDPELYKHIYLGKPRKLEGAIYRSFKTSEKIVNGSIYSVGVDIGYSLSKTYCGTIRSNYQDIQVVDVAKYDDVNRDTETTIEFIIEYLLGIKSKFKTTFMYLVVDNAERGLYRQLEKRVQQLGFVEMIDMQKVEIEERIIVVNHLFALERLHISKNIPDLPDALEEAIRDEKGKRLDDGTFNMDVIDMLEYALYPIWDYFDDLLGWKRGV